MQIEEMSFVYNLEKTSQGDYLLSFGKSNQAEGYSLCRINPLPGSEDIVSLIGESLNEGPSMMADISSLQEENAFLREKIERLTKELKILKESVR